MLKVLIVDDERLARAELRKMLEKMPDIEIVGEGSHADEAINLVEELHPDLVFLDIQMPGKNGFELLEELTFTPEIIFVTAYDEFAIKAFEVNAFDYILKPIEESRLIETVKRASTKLAERKQEDIGSSSEVLGLKDQVFVKDGDNCWFVTLEDVSYFESIGNYVRIFFNGNKPLILRSLNSLEKRLDSKVFFRASRKNIINLRWVKSVESWYNGGLLVILKNDAKIEISRRQSAKLKEMMSL